MTIELNVDQLQTLVEIMTEDNGLKLTKQSFIEVALDLFKDISGMEHATHSDSSVIINKLWNLYIMNASTSQSPSPSQTPPAKSIPSNPALYKEAIKVGKQTLLSEVSKA